MHSESTRQLGAVAFTDQSQPVLTGTQEFSFKVKRWQVDQSGCCPILQSRINVDWFSFDPQMFTPLFPRLYDGILYDVFIQKAAVAWDNAPNSRIMVSLLLPGPMEADQWLRNSKGQQTHVAFANDLTPCCKSAPSKTSPTERQNPRKRSLGSACEKAEPQQVSCLNQPLSKNSRNVTNFFLIIMR